MNKRTDYISWGNYFMAIAQLSSLRSKDPNTQVGACIVKDNKIIGIGYNGFPNGCSDNTFSWKRIPKNPLDSKYLYIIHAEQNAILNSNFNKLNGAFLYVSLFPCNECAKSIIQVGIKKIYYLDDKYKDTISVIASKKMLDAVGIKYYQFSSNLKEIKIKL
jgi:dCMP deaminase